MKAPTLGYRLDSVRCESLCDLALSLFDVICCMTWLQSPFLVLAV